MRDEVGRKKEASEVKQTKQSNTTQPRQLLFQRKINCLGIRIHNTLYYRQSAPPARQLSWLGPNLTSHSTPDEQASYQFSMKEKAGVMKPHTIMQYNVYTCTYTVYTCRYMYLVLL